jgi:hypothetical protein
MMALVGTGVNGLMVMVGAGWLMVVAAADGLTAAAAVVGAAGAEDDMVSDTRWVRRTLLRRKYGGEKACRGLAGRRRDGAVL